MALSRTMIRPVVLCVLMLPGMHALNAQAAKRAPQIGIASFYAEDFHGKKTANGETFNMWAMTAAHQTLPFNTLVRVTNLENGKSVIVRINDAGPFKDERIIDLTRGAAARLGMIRNGKAKVRLDIVGEAPSPAGEHVSRNAYYSIAMHRKILSGFGIQLASFTDMDNLIRRIDALEKKGVSDLYVQIAETPSGTVHRLIAGGFDTRSDAEAFLGEMKRKGIGGFVFQIR